MHSKENRHEEDCQGTSRSQASIWTQLLIPLAALVRGDMLALVHQLGLQAVAAMLEAERTELCGERYRHDDTPAGTRGGTVRGELALGGRRVGLKRLRVVDRKGREIALDTWEQLGSTDPLAARALEQMAIGVATRKYARSLEQLPDGVATRGTSKSAVSRFVAITTEKLTEWMSRPPRRARHPRRLHRRYPLRRAHHPLRVRGRRGRRQARSRPLGGRDGE